jgi:5-methylcytosine-specific restriction endonuclease McrA
VPPATDRERVQFLLNLQRLLSEGLFVATYKYALLMALADLAVEKGDEFGEADVFSTKEIAEKFIQYYWRQTLPYVSAGSGAQGLLKQNQGKQAAVVNLVEEARSTANGSISAARGNPALWGSLVAGVESIVKGMPLWKLQTIGREEVAFLYRNTHSGSMVELLPGVADNLRFFHTLIPDLMQGAWVRHVRGIGENQQLLGDTTDLREFMFGAERENLAAYRPILVEVQAGLCFYCLRPVHKESDVDHFIPWTRYPVDFGHNFVLAHASCNRRKRDYLAAEEHLERWLRRNGDWNGPLMEHFRARNLPASLSNSTQIAQWAYGQAELAQAHLWVKDDEVRPIGPGWRRLFAESLGGGAGIAADSTQPHG